MRHLTAGIAAIILWSMTIPLFKSVCSHMDPICGLGVSFGIGGALLSACTFKQIKHSIAAQSTTLQLCAVSLFIGYEIFLVFGIDGASNNRQALEVGLMNYLWPMMMIVCSLFFFKHQWNMLLPLGLLCSFCGVIYASMPHFSLSEIGILQNPIPYSLGFIAAVCWGLYSVINRRFGDPHHPAPVSLYTLICGALFCLWSLADGTFSIPSIVLFDLSVLTLSTALAYFFWDYAVHKGDLIVLASMSYFTPMLSILFGAFYLDHVVLNSTLLGGSIAVIAGAFLCKAGVKKPSVKQSSESSEPSTIASS